MVSLRIIYRHYANMIFADRYVIKKLNPDKESVFENCNCAIIIGYVRVRDKIIIHLTEAGAAAVCAKFDS